MHNLAMNGRIEEVAVAKDQKGKKMGLRILWALVHISSEAGCQKVSKHRWLNNYLPITSCFAIQYILLLFGPHPYHLL